MAAGEGGDRTSRSIRAVMGCVRTSAVYAMTTRLWDELANEVTSESTSGLERGVSVNVDTGVPLILLWRSPSSELVVVPEGPGEYSLALASDAGSSELARASSRVLAEIRVSAFGGFGSPAIPKGELLAAVGSETR